MKRAKFLSLLLTFAMLLSLVSIPALAAEDTADQPTEKTETTGETTASKTFEDVTDHWGKTSVERWAGYGVLNGDPAGNFNPDAQMTRAEFATMLVNMLGYTEKAENTFADVPADAWFADAVLKLAAAGVMKGDGTNANPNAPISRQEAAVLLCRAFNIAPSKDAKIDFADGEAVADWASDAVAALTERGMIAGVGENNFAPVANITRASVAKLADNMVAEYVTADKEITGEVKGLVVVAGDAEVTLKDAKLAENVIVAPKAGEAEVTLTGKTTAGNIYVQSDASAVKVEKGATAASVLVDASKASVEVAGKVESIMTTETAAEAAVTVAKGATVDAVALAGEDAKLDVTGTVKDVEVSATAKGADIVANQGAKITNVTTSAADVKVSGKGTVSNVTADAGSVDVTTKGTKVKNDGADKVTAGGKEVADGKTNTTPGGSTGGGGGSSHSYAYTVTINVTNGKGGTVTADVTETDKDDTEVSLTVKANDGWKLKDGSLMVKGPKDDTAQAVVNNKFKMTDKGNYVVTAEFVQPLTTFEIFPVASETDYAKLHEINAEAFPAAPDYELEDYPWLAIHAERGEGFDTKIKVSDLTITRNGTTCDKGGLVATEFGTLLTAYIGDTIPDGHDLPGGVDKLGMANKSGYYEVSVVYDGVTYTDAIDFTAKGETPVTVKFVTEAGDTVASYPAVTGETINIPEAPAIEGKVFVEWQAADKTAVSGTVEAGSTDSTYTAHYIEIKDLEVSRREGIAVEDDTAEANYTAAYEAIGAMVDGAKGVYTVSVDALKLDKIAADDTSEIYKVLENKGNNGKLWVGLDYKIPANAMQYQIAWDDAGFDGALAAEKRNFVTTKDGSHVFDYQIVWSNDTFATEGQDVFVIWLDKDGKPMEAAKAEIKLEIVATAIKSVAVVDGADGFSPVTVPEVGQKLYANVTLANDTVIGVYPVDSNLSYLWYYAEGSDNVLGTEPAYTVTKDNVGKTICVKVSGKVPYSGSEVWEAADVVEKVPDPVPVECDVSEGIDTKLETLYDAIKDRANGTSGKPALYDDIDPDKYYVELVDYTEDSAELTVGELSFGKDEPVKTSFGNYRFIHMPAYKVEGGKLYVALPILACEGAPLGSVDIKVGDMTVVATVYNEDHTNDALTFDTDSVKTYGTVPSQYTVNTKWNDETEKIEHTTNYRASAAYWTLSGHGIADTDIVLMRYQAGENTAGVNTDPHYSLDKDPTEFAAYFLPYKDAGATAAGEFEYTYIIKVPNKGWAQVNFDVTVTEYQAAAEGPIEE